MSFWFAVDKKGSFPTINAIVVTIISHCQACSQLGLSRVYYTCFEKMNEKIGALKNGHTIVLYKIGSTVCKIHPSPPRLLAIQR